VGAGARPPEYAPAMTNMMGGVQDGNHRRSVTYLTLIHHTKISDVDELKRRIIIEWAALSHTVIDSAVREWRQRLLACVRAGGGHFEHTLK